VPSITILISRPARRSRTGTEMISVSSYLSGSKLEAEKVKVDVGKVATPVDILAVDDLRLLRMQHQLAGRQAVGNRAPECPRLLGALAMTNDVVRVPLEQDVRKVPHHPRVEPVMQEEVCQ
jgi:hypothetical protein